MMESTGELTKITCIAWAGVRRDGLSRHFFHRPSKAYTTGTRKRRKIQNECAENNKNMGGGETRWHKTGKTRPVMVNGKQKGCKKILVLYTNFGKNRKPEKTNWVMHQYHLGQHEEEKEGELVVSKIFYQTQPRQCNWTTPTTNTNTTTLPNASTGDHHQDSSSLPIMLPNPTHTQSHQRDQDPIPIPMSSAVNVGLVSSFAHALDNIQHHLNIKPHHFGFIPPFSKTTFHHPQVLHSLLLYIYIY